MAARIFLLVGLLIGLASPAQALVHINAYLGPNLSQRSFDEPATTVSATGKISFTAGASLALTVFPMFEVEGGVLVNRSSVEYSKPLSATQVVTDLQVPVLLRFSPIDLISLGAGLYVANKLGDASPFYPAEVSSVASFSETQPGLHYGAILALGTRVSLLPAVALVGDVRYLLGFTKVSATSTDSLNQETAYNGGVSQLQLLLGVSFGI